MCISLLLQIPEIITETGHDRKTITKYPDMTDDCNTSCFLY